MRDKATHVYADLPHLNCSHNERPPLTITPAGRLVLVPSLEELMSRRGTKGLQECLDDLSHHHFMVHGYDWRYTGGMIKPQSPHYFVHFTGDVHYLGKFHQALKFLMDYAKTARPNDALRRLR